MKPRSTGPKIDVQIWSVIGREFSLTNQVDFAQPARFDLKYVNKDGQEEMPLGASTARRYPRTSG
ncbi:MAG: hypothetical protein U0X92_11085 [Anaerolineales bacterium]